VNSGVKINGKYYRETLLKEELLPDMRDISEYFIFQQYSAPAKETVDLLSTETPAFIPPTLWPPNSPDLTPVDYKFWSLLRQQVYKVKVNNVDELRQRIQTVCDELFQRTGFHVSWKVLESPGFFFFKIPGPGKSWKITLVLESPGN